MFFQWWVHVAAWERLSLGQDVYGWEIHCCQDHDMYTPVLLLLNIMKQILAYFKTLLHEDMVNNFGHFKMFLSIHVHEAPSLSEVAKKIFILPGQQASKVRNLSSSWYLTTKTFHCKKLLIHVGKRVNLEILNVKGLNLSFLATPDAFKLQVQHCRYHSLQRNTIKLQLSAKAWGKLTNDSKQPGFAKKLCCWATNTFIDSLTGTEAGIWKQHDCIMQEFVIIAKPNICTGSFNLHCWLVVPTYSTKVQTKLNGRV